MADKYKDYTLEQLVEKFTKAYERVPIQLRKNEIVAVNSKNNQTFTFQQINDMIIETEQLQSILQTLSDLMII